MKGESAFGWAKAIILFIVVGALAYLIYKIVSKAGDLKEGIVTVGELIQDTFADIADAAAPVIDAVNPVSQTNLANRAFNAVTRAEDGRSFGSSVYDFFNKSKMDAIRAATPYPAPTVKPVLTPADLDDSDQGFRMWQPGETAGVWENDDREQGIFGTYKQ